MSEPANTLPPATWPPKFHSGGALRDEWEYLQRLAAVNSMDPSQLIIPGHGYVPVGEINLHYVEWPTSQAPAGTILFLHGGALQARTWDAVGMLLRDSYRCIAVDLRGHGESSWSSGRDYQLSAHAADISAFIVEKRLEPVILVGHSLGGLIAMTVAASSQPAIAALVLVDIAPARSRDGTGRVRDFISSRQTFQSAEELLEHVLRFAPQRRKELLAGSLLYNVQVLPDGTLGWKYDPSQFSGEPDPGRDEEQLWNCIVKTSGPILLVRGGRSGVVTADTADRLVKLARDGRSCLIEGAGHTVQGDDPRALARAIRTFLASVPGS
jgi:esterase